MRRCLLYSAVALLIVLVTWPSVSAQSSGRLKGTVRLASGGTVEGAVVIVTNQVTGKVRRVRVGPDGNFSLQLPAGAYRLALEPPNVAQFDKDKNYGDYILVRGDRLENVIIEPDKEITIDVSV